MLLKLKKIRFLLVNVVAMRIRALFKSRELNCIKDNTSKIGGNDILLLSVLRNEAFRIPYFLEYYRKMGVDHFLFVDNDSTDGFLGLVEREPDISIWHTKGSYKNSRFGIDWANYLLGRYGNRHWCLTVDPDEFLVYPHYQTRDLKALTDHLAYIGQERLFSLLLDMYNDKTIAESHCQVGEDPLKTCPYFDTNGYRVQKSELLQNLWIQGGPRMRLFFRDKPMQAPALNKMPLVFWRQYYAYQSSTHALAPRRLNKVHEHRVELTGCLLHFKFFSVLKEKAEEEISRKQHFAGSREYEKYLHGIVDESLCLMSPFSAKLNNPEDLVKHGLMTTGGWF